MFITPMVLRPSFFPVENVSEADRTELFQSIGVASLKLFDPGFSTQGYYGDLTLDELREEMELILAEEIDYMYLDLIAKLGVEDQEP